MKIMNDRVDPRMRRMLIRMAAALAGAVALGGAVASADPITYSTAGTVDVPNEPDKTLYGVSGAAVAGSVPPPGEYTVLTEWPYRFGSVNILPIRAVEQPGVPGNPIPDYAHATADVTVTFSDPAIPTLNIKAAFGEYNYDYSAYVGNVAAITSSNPALNSSLPAEFAAMLANPAGLKLKIGMWDWDVESVPIFATYNPTPVPEPSTAALFAVLAGGLAWRRRGAARCGAAPSAPSVRPVALADLIFLDFAVEGPLADAEKAGGFLAVAAGDLQGFGDVVFFNLVERFADE